MELENYNKKPTPLIDQIEEEEEQRKYSASFKKEMLVWVIAMLVVAGTTLWVFVYKKEWFEKKEDLPVSVSKPIIVKRKALVKDKFKSDDLINGTSYGTVWTVIIVDTTNKVWDLKSKNVYYQFEKHDTVIIDCSFLKENPDQGVEEKITHVWKFNQ